MKIKSLVSRMILDSRGYPTVEVDCILMDGSVGRAAVPSGASTGSHEARELRDGGTLYGGKGVLQAVEHIRNEITQKILDVPITSQRELDTALLELDGTENKEKLGANALLAVSLAYAKACSVSKGVPLYKHLRETFTWSRELSIPVPLINVLNGGRHAASSTDIQEWMIVPLNSPSLSVALEKAASVFYVLREMMSERGSSAVGDEGGFPISNVSSNEEALTILTQAVTRAGYVPGQDIAFALDVAASEFFNDGYYNLQRDDALLSEDEMITYLERLVGKYPIISIEDGLAEDAWSGWQELTKRIGNRVQLVGDDLFVTNTKYIQKGGDEGVANAVLIKPNQIGTLSETVDAIELAHHLGKRAIISHRSGETEDTFIAHLAVASGCGQIKTGSLSRSERLAKYNELLRISEEGVPYSSKID